jgi:hypothetical protein
MCDILTQGGGPGPGQVVSEDGPELVPRGGFDLVDRDAAPEDALH